MFVHVVTPMISFFINNQPTNQQQLGKVSAQLLQNFQSELQKLGSTLEHQALSPVPWIHGSWGMAIGMAIWTWGRGCIGTRNTLKKLRTFASDMRFLHNLQTLLHLGAQEHSRTKRAQNGFLSLVQLHYHNRTVSFWPLLRWPKIVAVGGLDSLLPSAD